MRLKTYVYKDVSALIITLSLCFSVYCQTDKFINYKNQLSNSHINHIYQDHKGLIWISTENGLNVYDGTNIFTYYHSEEDTLSINNNSVLCVLEDSQNNFWIGTSTGLQLFDRKNGIFKDFPLSHPRVGYFGTIKCILEDSKGNIWISSSGNGIIRLKSKTLEPVFYMQTNSNICSNNINCLLEDKFGNIWIGSENNGLSILNIENSTLVNYSHNPNDRHSLSNDNIFSLCEYTDGSILIGTLGGGINKFNPNTRTFEQIVTTSENLVFSLFKDNTGKLWVGTDGDGLYTFDANTKKLNQYESNLISPDLRTAKIHDIIQDKQGNLWIALYQNGVLMIPSNANPFQNIGFNPHHPEKSIGNHCVLSILKDRKEQLWIGTDGDGIYKFNKNGVLIRHYTHSTAGNLPGNSILSIFEDSKGRIWIGSYLQSLHQYIPEKDQFVSIPLNNDKKALFSSITGFAEDKNGNLWMGSMGNGLCKYEVGKKQATIFQYIQESTANQIIGDYINTIVIDENQKIWMGTSEGLNCLDLKTGLFKAFTTQDGIMNSNIVYSLLKEKNGNLWIGTRNGLSCYNPSSGKSVTYNHKNGLSNDVVSGIEKDRNGNLWISTNMGLSMLDKQTKTFSNYFVYDGLQDNEFRRGAHFITSEGELFFGGINGVTHFYPSKFQPDHELINLMFTNLFIYNQKITPGDKNNEILSKDINSIDKLKLPYSTKNFTIGFIAVEFNNPEKVTYMVKMEGFDSDWKTVFMKDRSVTYTNLNPGSYTFRVKAFIGNEEAKEKALYIVITPPFWMTWWAKSIYVLAFLLIIYFAYRTIVNRLNKKKEEVRKLHEEQLMQSKLQFFTDISHEIRTPLTLVQTPLEALIKETSPGKLQNTYLLIHQNAERILKLVNQLMDVRKIDKGQMKLKAEETNIVSFLNNIKLSFDEIALQKQIDFPFTSETNLPLVWIDQDKIDKVIFNLLSNAFKFTPESGSIQINVFLNDNLLKISITDTGPGIPDEFKELIFDRFFQVPSKNNFQRIGTGIGLHLSKSLMELQKGNITVRDNIPNGTIFEVGIPLGKDHLSPEEISSEPTEKSIEKNKIIHVIPTVTIHSESSDELIKRKKKKHKILIVEDDLDIQFYLAEQMTNEYQVLMSSNGKEGLEKAILECPDCIITDLMMPEMDGITFAKKVKANERLCHIPVIILTARTNIDQEIEGLETGADSYITKPFNIELLKIRIKKLIEQRGIMKQKFEGKFEINDSEINIQSPDELFLEKFELLIKERITEAGLSVEVIAKEMGISRSQLQRKMKQLNGQNPSDYVKILRLRHAAKLLETKKIPIAEIAYASGFSSLGHFSSSFREFYGIAPSAYSGIK